jgi:hypothetical protein
MDNANIVIVWEVLFDKSIFNILRETRTNVSMYEVERLGQ